MISERISGVIMVVSGLVILARGEAGRTIIGMGPTHQLEPWQVYTFSILTLVFGIVLLTRKTKN
jgi:hypothetical protein